MGYSNIFHFQELTWSSGTLINTAFLARQAGTFCNKITLPTCCFHLKCELKMQQRYPVTQMALSFRDRSGLQTPVMNQQPGFHEMMPPHRERVLGGSVMWAAVTFVSLLSGVDVARRLVDNHLSRQASYTFLPAFLLLLPSSSILFPDYCQTWRGHEGRVQLQSTGHLAWRAVSG